MSIWECLGVIISGININNLLLWWCFVLFWGFFGCVLLFHFHYLVFSISFVRERQFISGDRGLRRPRTHRDTDIVDSFTFLKVTRAFWNSFPQTRIWYTTAGRMRHRQSGVIRWLLFLPPIAACWCLSRPLVGLREPIPVWRSRCLAVLRSVMLMRQRLRPHPLTLIYDPLHFIFWWRPVVSGKRVGTEQLANCAKSYRE